MGKSRRENRVLSNREQKLKQHSSDDLSDDLANTFKKLARTQEALAHAGYDIEMEGGEAEYKGEDIGIDEFLNYRDEFMDTYRDAIQEASEQLGVEIYSPMDINGMYNSVDGERVYDDNPTMIDKEGLEEMGHKPEEFGYSPENYRKTTVLVAQRVDDDNTPYMWSGHYEFVPTPIYMKK